MEPNVAIHQSIVTRVQGPTSRHTPRVVLSFYSHSRGLVSCLLIFGLLGLRSSDWVRTNIVRALSFNLNTIKLLTNYKKYPFNTYHSFSNF